VKLIVKLMVKVKEVAATRTVRQRAIVCMVVTTMEGVSIQSKAPTTATPMMLKKAMTKGSEVVDVEAKVEAVTAKEAKEGRVEKEVCKEAAADARPTKNTRE